MEKIRFQLCIFYSVGIKMNQSGTSRSSMSAVFSTFKNGYVIRISTIVEQKMHLCRRLFSWANIGVDKKVPNV